MSDAAIAAIELRHVALPTRREHKWTGLTEPIGGYVLVKMTDAVGRVLFTDYLFPFEVTSVLLLVAIVGVMALTKRRA